MKSLSILIAIPCGSGFFHYQTTHSLLKTVIELQNRAIGFEVKILPGCSIVEEARNILAHEFLNSQHTHLFMVDSDMQWTPEQFLKLLKLSDILPVVCAMYTEKNDSGIFHVKLNGRKITDSNPIEINGAGLGFTLVHREVIQELANKAPAIFIKNTKMPRIFSCNVVDGEFQGEDMKFFSDCQEAGYKIYLDPSITLGHIGTKVYSTSIINGNSTSNI